jgi:hypothetical protein
METGRFLRLSAALAAELAELHSRNIIHEPRFSISSFGCLC